MAYTAPKTWAAATPLSASDLNTHVRDNLVALKTPPNAFYFNAGNPLYTTTSTSLTDVDATNLALSITPAVSSYVLVWVTGVWGLSSAPADIYMTLRVNSTDVASSYGLVRGNSTSKSTFSFVYRADANAGASNTYKLRWKVSANTGRIYNVAMFVIDLV